MTPNSTEQSASAEITNLDNNSPLGTIPNPRRSDIHGILQKALTVLASQTRVPAQFLNPSNFTHISSNAVPIHLIRIKWNVNWTASFGYDRRELQRHRDSNGKIEMREVTVTEWRPVNGQDSGAASFCVYAGTQEATHVAYAAEQFPDLTIAEDEIAATNAIEIEEFALEGNATYHSSTARKEASAIDNSVRKHAIGAADRHQGWHWTGDVERERFPMRVPVHNFRCSFNTKESHIAVAGKDNLFVSYDTIPTYYAGILKAFWPYMIPAFVFLMMINNVLSYGFMVYVFWFSLVAAIVNHLVVNRSLKSQRELTARGEL